MLKSLLIFLRFILFWMIFFFLDRLIFLLYFADKLLGSSINEVLKSFLHGLRLDLSMAAYISAIPLLIYIACLFFPKIRLSVKVPRFYTRLLIILFSLFTIINFNIYREWGSKINYRALDYAFTAPQEALASSESSPILSSFLIFFVLVVISLMIERKLVDYHLPVKISLPQKFLTILFIPFAFLAIRGGWQLSPINESMSYYSQKPFLNYATVNTEWSLIHDILDNAFNHKNPYKYLNPEEAKEITDKLFSEPADGSTPEILTTKQPNVVVIILESYTADVIESLGGEKGIAPQFEKLIRNGLFFNKIYAAGNRTDKGLIAVLSAFPAQAIRSIMTKYNKQNKLPALSQVFKNRGYNTSFYYGGESEFFNMKSYFLSHGYEQIVDKHAFDPKDMNSKWGAYDGAVYNKQLQDLRTKKQPFFSTLLTLTNHEPFELPVNPHFKGESLSAKFKSTAYYADSCLYRYLNDAQKQPWYKNTLFIIVADHGHRLPTNKYETYHPYRFRIPLLFYGGAVKPEFRGKKVEKIGSQTDIASTLLTQIGIKNDGFKWSKNLLNSRATEFAFFNWENGFGVATPKQTLSFDNVGRNVTYKKNTVPDSINNKVLKYGKACMQEVFQEYLDF